MYEDSAIELEAFASFSRVFCIASAGCTARALSAAGHDVTAVDINPRQILYAQARAAGAPIREGATERLLSRGRTLFPLLGWTEPRRRTFLSMRDPCEQLHYWEQTLNSKRWRIAVDTVLSAWLLGLVYKGPLVASLPRHFGSLVRARLERTWRNHANDSNPYARRLLLGETQPIAEPPTARHSFRVCGRSYLFGNMRARELRCILVVQHCRRRVIILHASFVQGHKARRRARGSRRHAQLRGARYSY